MTLCKAFLVLTSILSGCVLAGCNRPQGTKPESDKSGSPIVVNDRGAGPAGERIESFESIPADVKKAITDGKTVWAIDGLNFVTLAEGRKGERHAFYAILQRGKLQSFVQKSNVVLGVDTDKRDHVSATSYPANRFPVGANFTFRVEGSQDGETRLKLRFQKDTHMNKDPNNIITGESTIDLTLVWNKGGDKGSWEATEEGWTQVQSRGKQFDRQPINRDKNGFAARLSTEKAAAKEIPKEERTGKTVESPRDSGKVEPPRRQDEKRKDGPPTNSTPKEPTTVKARLIRVYKIVFPGDVLLTTSEKEANDIPKRYPGPFKGDSGHYLDVFGYAYAEQQPDTVLLRRYIVNNRHVYTTSGLKGPAVAEEGMGAWVFKEPAPGTSLRLGFRHDKDKTWEYGPKWTTDFFSKLGYSETNLRFYMFDKPDSPAK